jgi:hypothetical protein
LGRERFREIYLNEMLYNYIPKTYKMKRGRPLTHDVKNNRATYFREYYHSSNEEHICECGAMYKLNSKRKHMLTKKHTHYMELLTHRKELVDAQELIEHLRETIEIPKV